MRQIHTTPADLWRALPEGDLPETVKFDGIEFTTDQIDKIHRTVRGDIGITVQRLSRKRVAVRTDLQPRVSPWFIYDEHGETEIQGLADYLARNREEG